MEEQLMNIKNDALSLVLDAKDEKSLEEIKLQFVGRSGKLTLALKNIAKLPLEKRPEIGALANDVKQAIENAISSQEGSLKHHVKERTRQAIDITNPGIKQSVGHLHLITQPISEITSIFQQTGFQKISYPELEWDYYAFTALNFPENHPARDDWETFFTTEESDNEKGQIILTPHTSSGQVREMQKA